jgi:hypothetical protein
MAIAASGILGTAHKPNWFIFCRGLKFSGAARRQIENVLCPLVQVARSLGLLGQYAGELTWR